MKQSKRCPKCGSRRIGHLACLPDTFGHQETITTERALGTALVDGKRTRIGHLEAYVCANCGYLEEYVADPQRTPFDSIEGFSWVRGAPPSPYR